MYFGSVRFFRHLILIVVGLLIAVPITICIVLGIQNSEITQENAELQATNAALQTLVSYSEDELTAEQLCALLEANKISGRDFVNLLYNKDKTAFRDVLSSAASGDDSAVTTAPDAQQAIVSADVTPTGGETATSSSPLVTTASMTKATTTTPETKTTAETTTTVPPADYEALYPELYASGTSDITYDDDSGTIYLTFDDGPSVYTHNILYYLRLYDIKATFFLLPDGTDECADLMRQIVNEGHAIGIHTASHVYKDIYASVEAYLDDFNTAYNRIFDATGVKPVLFRFPGGSVNDYNRDISDELIDEMTRRGFIYFDWNVDSRDAMGANWTEMYNTVLTEVSECKNRAVVLMHDRPGGENTVLVLEDIIKALMNDPKNYKFASLTENVRPVQF